MGVKPFDQVGITVPRRDMQERLQWVIGMYGDVILATHLDFPAGRIDCVFPYTFLDFGSLSSTCSSKCGRSQGLNTLLLKLCPLGGLFALVFGFRFLGSCFRPLSFPSLFTF